MRPAREEEEEKKAKGTANAAIRGTEETGEATQGGIADATEGTEATVDATGELAVAEEAAKLLMLWLDMSCCEVGLKLVAVNAVFDTCEGSQSLRLKRVTKTITSLGFQPMFIRQELSFGSPSTSRW